MFRSIETVPYRFQLLECDSNRAVLAARKKKSGLSFLQVSLDACPSRRADPQAGAGDMRGDLAFLERMKLLQLFQSEGKHVVVQGLGRAAEKPLQCRLVSGCLAGVYLDGAAHVTAGFTFQTQSRVADQQVEVSTVSPTFQRFVAFGRPSLLKAEKHRTDKRHERALARFIRSVKHIEAGTDWFPGLVVPDAETINMDTFNSHAMDQASNGCN